MLPIGITGYHLGCLGALYGIFSYFVYKMFLFLLLLLNFFLFQIKTCGFHLKEEGKELLGMLMAVLAKLMYCTCFLCFLKKSIAIFKINWH